MKNELENGHLVLIAQNKRKLRVFFVLFFSANLLSAASKRLLAFARIL